MYRYSEHIIQLTHSLFQIIGCILIGYMAWVMATSVTVHRFLNGDMVSVAPNP